MRKARITTLHPNTQRVVACTIDRVVPWACRHVEDVVVKKAAVA
jgi:hypothetical protein